MDHAKKDKDLAQFIRSLAGETDEIFRLTSGEENVRREFIRLAYEIYRCPEARKKICGQHVSYLSFRYSIANVMKLADTLPSDLVQKCKAWQNTYELFLERNPKVELYYMLKDMSETDLHESWFSDSTMESRILDWVDSNNYEPLPLLDRDHLGIVTPEFYARLRLLRQRCGGWLFPAHVTLQILFVADNDIGEVRWQRDQNGKYLWPAYWPKWR